MIQLELFIVIYFSLLMIPNHLQMPAALESKLFILQTHGQDDVEWVEQATGIPSFFKDENVYKLTFRSQDENVPYLYELTVNDNVSFDRSQPKIITWTVIKQNIEAALSFRDQGGANSFWYLIDEYMKKDSVQVQSGTLDHFVIEFRMPDATKSTLPEVYKELEVIPYIEKRERISSIFLTKIDLLPSLCKLFTVLQAQGVQKNRQSLITLFQIMKIILNFGDCQLITQLLNQHFWRFTIGALQYDPQFFGYPHRKFLQQQVRFLQVIPLKNSDRLKLIHITFRLDYVKDCVLAAHLDETGYRTLTMIILNNYKDILKFIFNPREKEYLNEILAGLRNMDIRVHRLLWEICKIGKNIDIFYGSVEEVSKGMIFSTLAEKQVFEILMENLVFAMSEKAGEEIVKSKGKSRVKTPEDLKALVKITLDVILLSLEVNQNYFKDYCSSEKQIILKYPTINFLFKQLANTATAEWEQFNKIVALLNDGQGAHPLNYVIQKMSIDLILAKGISPASAIEILNKLCEVSSTQLLARLDQIIYVIFTHLIPQTKSKSCLRITILQSFKKLVNSFCSTNRKILLPSLMINIESITNVLRDTRARNTMQLSVILQSLRILAKNGQYNFLNSIIKALQSDKSQVNSQLAKQIHHVINYKYNQEFNIKRQKSEIRLGEETFEGIIHKTK